MILEERELAYLFTELEWFNLKVRISPTSMCYSTFQYLPEVTCMKSAL